MNGVWLVLGHREPEAHPLNHVGGAHVEARLFGPVGRARGLPAVVVTARVGEDQVDTERAGGVAHQLRVGSPDEGRQGSRRILVPECQGGRVRGNVVNGDSFVQFLKQAVPIGLAERC